MMIIAAGLTGCKAIPEHRAESTDFSSQRLDRIREAMDARIEADRFAGAVGMIVHKDQTVLLDSYGYLDRESNTPMPADAIFRIASMTKPITSVGIMMLVEQGKISLIDPVSKYLPELAEMQVAVSSGKDPSDGEYTLVPANKPITIYDLLRHTSGFGYGFLYDTAVDRMYNEHRLGNADSTSSEFITTISQIPLKHQPGTVWEYSFSIDVLARVIEVVSGKPIDEYFQTHIFAPLGMIDTGYFVPESKLDRLASVYYTDPQLGMSREDRINAQDVTTPPTFLAGGSGLFSTASDYARFCRMLLGGGQLDGHRLLAPSTVRLMTSDHIGRISEDTRWVRIGSGYGFGLGFAVRLADGGSPFIGSQGDYGWAGAWGTGFWVDPKHDLIGIFMIQNYWQHTYRNEFRTLVYQAMNE